MSKINQRTPVVPLTVPCPACRTELCHYDWISVKPKDSSVSSSSFLHLTKIKKIKDTINAIFVKRRFKKRSSPLVVVVLTPPLLKETIASFLNEEYVVRTSLQNDTSEAEEPKNVVYVFNFEQMDLVTTLVDDSLEGVLISCPSKSPEMYYDLIRSCCTMRSFPLQVHLFDAPQYENAEELSSVFLK
jgi:hypothetical protein